MKAMTSLDGYDAFVIGAPVYMGKVIDITKFVGRFKDTLAGKPVAAFAVGLAVVSNDPKQQEESRKALDASLAPVKPVAVTLFGGVVNPAKLSFLQRKMTELAKSPIGDFRDWNAIAAWARELPGTDEGVIPGIEKGKGSVHPDPRWQPMQSFKLMVHL